METGLVLIKENNEAALWSKDGRSFEVWMKIRQNHGKNKGQILNPKDEDFGVWAWSFYLLGGAENCFDEITSGKRKIRPMVDRLIH